MPTLKRRLKPLLSTSAVLLTAFATFTTITTLNNAAHASHDKTVTAPSKAFYQQVVDNKNRPGSDLSRDKSRQPAALLAFMQLKPGMVVFELGASGGYTTEILARAIGSKGKLFAEGLSPSRVANGRLPQVKPLGRGLIYQIPERAAKAGLKNGEVDTVVIMFTYHDLALNERINRQDMLQNMLQMLKPGGSIIIADNSAVTGSGLDDTQQLHRIDPQLIKKEFEQAGFVFAAKSDLYHNPKDNLKAHWRFLADRGQHERLLMRFVKKATK
ncbi:MAG: putative methyltransferase [Alteromonadaceae bacterium]|jgi:predicted methyltransferase